jgi:hypothetical protein
MFLSPVRQGGQKQNTPAVCLMFTRCLRCPTSISHTRAYNQPPTVAPRKTLVMFAHEIVQPESLTFEPRWLRIPAAVAYAGVSRAQLYVLLAQNQIRSASISTRGHRRGIRVVDRLSIDSYLESRLTPWATAQSQKAAKTTAEPIVKT